MSLGVEDRLGGNAILDELVVEFGVPLGTIDDPLVVRFDANAPELWPAATAAAAAAFNDPVDKAKRLAVAELEGDIPAADNAAAAAELGDKPACSPGCDDNVGNDDGFGPCKCAELGKPCCEWICCCIQNKQKKRQH